MESKECGFIEGVWSLIKGNDSPTAESQADSPCVAPSDDAVAEVTSEALPASPTQEQTVPVADLPLLTEQPSAEALVPWRIDTLRELELTREEHSANAILTFWREKQPPLLFYGSPDKVVQLTKEQVGNSADWFLLGDIHGDYYALRNAVEYVRCQRPNDFRLIFLGDLVDRGPHPLECLWYLLNLAKTYPGRIMWIAGNHDIGFSHDAAQKRFQAAHLPSEFLNHLNKSDAWFFFRQQLGKEFIELVAGLPRAALFPDGLLVTHGGFPHVDLQARLSECTTPEERRIWLNSESALQDFTQNRITKYRKKTVSRSRDSCQYGYEDFESFCRVTADFFPTSRLVTGHDHPHGGFDIHKEWVKMPALTLAGFGFGMNYENPEAFDSRYRDNLVVGRCREGQIPEVVKIRVDTGDLKRFFDAEIAPLFGVNVTAA